MPSGFENIESGLRLSLRLEKYAWQLRDHLKAARRRPDLPVTAENPVCASKICRGFNQPPWSWKITTVDVRAMTNYLRMRGEPIGSNSKGYWWAESPGELMSTVRHLRDRVVAELGAIAGLRSAVQRMTQGHLFDPSVDKVLDLARREL